MLSWIRIRIGNADPYPGEMKMTKNINKKNWFSPFQIGFFTYVGMLYDIIPT
jgi:hypothetical protein